VFVTGRGWDVDILPSQSERPFPILVWQVLFVNGIVLGWHREQVARRLRPHWRLVSGTILVVAAGFAGIQVGGPAVAEADAWARWEAEHFHKGSLDVARLAAMTSIAAAIYLGLRRRAESAERILGPLLLPLGRNSFYVFIMHVFVCLAVASIPALAAGGGLGMVGNTLVQLVCLALLWTMVRSRFLFRVVPR
jgi:OpgC protein